MSTRTDTASSSYPTLALVHLYPCEMSVNGDFGNFLVLLKRMQWRGIPVEVTEYRPGDQFPSQTDLIVGGGPQITGASVVQQDLLRHKDQLRACVESGTAALLVGGSFQLFGNYVETPSKERIEGLGIFDMYTTMGEQRFTGNAIATSELFGTIVGFENHSAKTYLSETQSSFVLMKSGAGNNGADKSEGAHYKHAIGSYLYGPLLPKNPTIADYLIARALEHCLGRPVDPSELAPLPEIDAHAAKAAAVAQTRPR